MDLKPLLPLVASPVEIEDEFSPHQVERPDSKKQHTDELE